MGRLRVNDPNTHSLSSSQPRIHRSGENVFNLLAQREISPRTKCMPRMRWGGAPKQPPEFTCGLKRESVRDARRGLSSWVEAESLLHLSAKYCSLVPPPRSTIAAAFSPDGKTLASTHGDHTVKIIDCQSGSCLKVLNGHCRTPWVVRFHPQYPEILASGSLDHEVRLWDANISECIESHNFYRPIASIAFHAEGELIAVASGHKVSVDIVSHDSIKLYLWHYKKRGDFSSPSMVLKTRRSLRAVHFHPHAAPFLLTAEVNELDSSHSSIMLATAPACVDCPLPSVYIANIHHTIAPNVVGEPPLRSLPLSCPSSYGRDDFRVDLQVSSGPVALNNSAVQSSALLQFQQDLTVMEQCDDVVFPIELSPSIPSDIHAAIQASDVHSSIHETTGIMETSELQLEGYRQSNFSNQFSLGQTNCSLPPLNQSGIARSLFAYPDNYPFQYGQQQYTSSADTTHRKLPYFQAWAINRNHNGVHPIHPLSGRTMEPPLENQGKQNEEFPVASLAMLSGAPRSVVLGRAGLQDQPSYSQFISEAGFGQGAAMMDFLPMINRIESELAASLTATSAAELPCTVKLRIWPHDLQNPCAPLDAERCRLTIPHAVLCSEMGAHFSPCGRYLAACVACVLPQLEADIGLPTQQSPDVTGAATSPTRHPISAQKVIYELRIYSLEESTFGTVLVSRAVRAAHCLTSIQFSPTSEHILLAYGRRHSSLLKSIVINGETSLPIYSVLEVYRVSDMELVSVLPSAEDEVNVACFHPLAGGGLVYGTKEGKLRVFQYDGALMG